MIIPNKYNKKSMNMNITKKIKIKVNKIMIKKN